MGLGLLTDEQVEWALHSASYYITATTPEDISERVSDIKTQCLLTLKRRKEERAAAPCGTARWVELKVLLDRQELEGGQLTPLTPTPPALSPAGEAITVLDQLRSMAAHEDDLMKRRPNHLIPLKGAF